MITARFFAGLLIGLFCLSPAIGEVDGALFHDVFDGVEVSGVWQALPQSSGAVAVVETFYAHNKQAISVSPPREVDERWHGVAGSTWAVPADGELVIRARVSSQGLDNVVAVEGETGRWIRWRTMPDHAVGCETSAGFVERTPSWFHADSLGYRAWRVWELRIGTDGTRFLIHQDKAPLYIGEIAEFKLTSLGASARLVIKKHSRAHDMTPMLVDSVTVRHVAADPATLPGSPLADATPPTPGSFTLAVLPDTQYYAEKWPHHFRAQTRWIAKQAITRDIRYVLHLGDIVEHGHEREEWFHARWAMAQLDGRVPYLLAHGNHDQGMKEPVRSTYLNQFFTVDEQRDWPTFGGAMVHGKLENAYHTVEIHGNKLLLLSLDFGPTDETLAWAGEVLADHPDHRAIIITHAYLGIRGERFDHTRIEGRQPYGPYDYGVRELGSINDGEQMWNKLIAQHANVMMVVCGHVHASRRRADQGTHGNLVHQILVDYQGRPEGGQGFLRLMEFLPDGRTVRMTSISPSFDRALTDAENQFDIQLEPPLNPW